MEKVQSKSKSSADLTGSVFHRWTVIGGYILTPRKERKWLCRCECGTERYVLERALKSGTSQSCGCLRRERTEKMRAYDLAGQTFGDLTVLRRDETQGKSGGIRWLCRCSCGKEYTALSTLLVNGKRTHCGCKTQKPTGGKDISGRKFSRLTALYPTEQRDAKGFVIWHCRCECGTELDVSYNTLCYSNIRSCGCQKKEHDQQLSGFLSRVDGTSIDILKSKKLPINNTTGVKGVYLYRGKYMAKIVFQKKQYLLGTYTTLEEAAAARKEAELHLNDTVLVCYARWKEKAAAEPEWAAQNPMRILVERDASCRLCVRCTPAMEDA